MTAAANTHECPCGCGRDITYERYSCRASWIRLPAELRQQITGNRRLSHAHIDAMMEARQWLVDNPPPLPAEAAQMAADALADLADLLRGTGEHAQHTRQQVGRCVYCSCGQRYQGRL